jgi:hypothetical protein
LGSIANQILAMSEGRGDTVKVVKIVRDNGEVPAVYTIEDIFGEQEMVSYNYMRKYHQRELLDYY